MLSTGLARAPRGAAEKKKCGGEFGRRELRGWWFGMIWFLAASVKNSLFRHFPALGLVRNGCARDCSSGFATDEFLQPHRHRGTRGM